MVHISYLEQQYPEELYRPCAPCYYLDLAKSCTTGILLTHLHLSNHMYECTSAAEHSTAQITRTCLKFKEKSSACQANHSRLSCVVWSLEYLALCMQRKTQQKRGGCRPPGSPATPKQPHRQARALRIGRTTACVGQTCTGVLSHTQQTAAMCLLFPRTTTT